MNLHRFVLSCGGIAFGYQTVKGRASARFVEKKSEFIGTIAPVSTETEAVAFISEMRKQHHDAAHNVYAYVLRDGQLKRYSDDGEPQVPAGCPFSVYWNEAD